MIQGFQIFKQDDNITKNYDNDNDCNDFCLIFEDLFQSNSEDEVLDAVNKISSQFSTMKYPIPDEFYDYDVIDNLFERFHLFDNETVRRSIINLLKLLINCKMDEEPFMKELFPQLSSILDERIENQTNFIELLSCCVSKSKFCHDFIENKMDHCLFSFIFSLLGQNNQLDSKILIFFSEFIKYPLDSDIENIIITNIENLQNIELKYDFIITLSTKCNHFVDIFGYSSITDSIFYFLRNKPNKRSIKAILLVKECINPEVYKILLDLTTNEEFLGIILFVLSSLVDLYPSISSDIIDFFTINDIPKNSTIILREMVRLISKLVISNKDRCHQLFYDNIDNFHEMLYLSDKSITDDLISALVTLSDEELKEFINDIDVEYINEASNNGNEKADVLLERINNIKE